MRDEFKPSALPYLCLKAGISKAVPLGRAGSFYLEKLMGFTKLDEGILQSSIMAEDSDTFKVWITLLATCKEDGIAHCSAVFLSSICRLPQERINEILDKLEKPDPDSRSTTKKGCRLKRVNGGYEIINYFKYRESALRRSEAERKRLYRQQLRKSKRPDMSGQCPDSSASASVYASSSLNIDINKEEERINIEEIKRGWNEFAGQHNLATVSKIDQKSERGRHLEARMAEKDWDFKKLLEIIGESSFLLGKKGKEPFFVTFDWLLWPGNYRRTMDGNYKDRVGKDMGGVQEWYEKEKAKEKEEREHE